MSEMERGWLYFGCHREAGHYLWKPSGSRASYDHPLGKFDGCLCFPERRQFVASLSRLGAFRYSALAFWDYSIDTRPGSNSIIFAPSLVVSAQSMVEGARRLLPLYAKRWPEIDISRTEYRAAPPPPLAQPSSMEGQ